MKPVIQLVESWWNEPVANWEKESDQIIEGANISKGTVLAGIMMSKWFPSIYTGDVYNSSDEKTKKMIDGMFSLLPVAQQISNDGYEVLSQISAISPPLSISYAHNTIIECLEEKIDWANQMIGYYGSGVLPSQVGYSCTLFNNALDDVNNFIAVNN